MDNSYIVKLSGRWYFDLDNYIGYYSEAKHSHDKPELIKAFKIEKTIDEVGNTTLDAEIHMHVPDRVINQAFHTIRLMIFEQ